MGEYNTALKLVQQALELEEGAGATPSYHRLGYLLYELGEYDRSLAEFHKLLNHEQRSNRGSDIAAGTALRFIATIHTRKAEYDQAEATFAQAITILRAHGAEAAAELTGALLQYGLHKTTIGKIVEEEPLLLEALKVTEDLYGAIHPKVANTLNSLGNHYRSRGDPEQAKHYHERAIDTKRRLYGDDNISVARTMANLGLVESQLANYGRAAQLMQDALVVFKAKLGEDHPNVAFLTENLANQMLAMGDHEAALTTYMDGVTRMRRIFSEEHPEYGSTISNLGGAYLLMGRYAQAQEQFATADRVFRSAYGDDHPNVAMNQVKLALAAREQGEPNQAIRLYQDSLAIFFKNYDAAHVEIALNYEKLGEVFVDTGQLGKAEQAFRGSVDQWRQLTDSNRRAWRVSARLGNVLQHQGRHDDAESLLLPAYESSVAELEADDAQITMIAEWLAQLYAATGRADEADKYRTD